VNVDNGRPLFWALYSAVALLVTSCRVFFSVLERQVELISMEQGLGAGWGKGCNCRRAVRVRNVCVCASYVCVV